jgi:hypothetical protein
LIWGSHSGGYEEFCLLGYNAVYSTEGQGMFRRNILPPSWWLKSEQAGSKEAQWTTRRYILEDKVLCHMLILRNVDTCLLANYIASSHCWRQQSYPFSVLRSRNIICRFKILFHQVAPQNYFSVTKDFEIRPMCGYWVANFCFVNWGLSPTRNLIFIKEQMVKIGDMSCVTDGFVLFIVFVKLMDNGRAMTARRQKKKRLELPFVWSRVEIDRSKASCDVQGMRS